VRNLISNKAFTLGQIAKGAGLEGEHALWKWWWALHTLPNPYQPRVFDPTTGDYIGVDIHLGTLRLTSNTSFELKGLGIATNWAAELPERGFLPIQIEGPVTLTLPKQGKLQVVRLDQK
jgi:hypothetical protein